MNTADYWIKNLEMIPHPEGGYFKESYRSPIEVSGEQLPIKNKFDRCLATSIYFLLRTGEVSHFHKLESDEIWYYQYGQSLTIHTINPKGDYVAHQLGPNIDKGEVMQLTIPAGVIFGSEMKEKDVDSYGLVGCMVAPGFDFRDFKLYTTNELVALFPKHEAVIVKLTKEEYVG